MEQLTKSASEDDWKKVEKTAHRMKSALRGMGIKAAANKVKLIEEMASTGKLDQYIHSHIKELNETIRKVLSQLNEDYPNAFLPK